MNLRKRLLLFATKLGYQTRSFNAVAEKLGVELAFVTDRCGRMDDPWNDHALPAHFELPETAARAILETQRGLHVDGVLVLGDRPGPTAAHVARGLGLLHNHPASVEACRNKLRTREVFREAGIPVPWFRGVSLSAVPEPALMGIHYPCVLKPLSLSASQGVVRANNREEFVAGAARLQRLLESPEIRATREPHLDQMLVEAYLPGREVAVEALLTEGTLRILAIFDKPDPLEGPYFEETIYVTPSRLPDSEQRAIGSSLRSAVQALGLTHGPVHAEFRLNEQGVWPIEVAPRPIGGLCARALRFCLAHDEEEIGLEELLLRHALGLPGGDAVRESAASGVMMIPVPRSGVLESVEGEEPARRIPGITSLEITARVHDYIAAWPEGSSYLGFLFARGDPPAAVEAALRAAHAQLKFTLTPRLPVEHPLTRTSPRADHP
ncbi:MAG TPA: ATP-grasp domain-containing protein [Candidatus Limnocylindrales bacterium]|nr:ATP-grasp domain-containing protein [Candidatus Limnocylindrales bacterium]